MDPTSKKPWYKNLFLWYFLIGAITLTLMRPLLRREPPPPPVVGQVPPFELVDQNGNSFSFSDLEGRVWVANFIFTSCPSICPLLTRGMAGLQQRYDTYGIDEIKLVSFSVDPENDTPEVLRDYAALHEADPGRWTFLTGEEAEIRELIVNGFKTAMSEPLTNDAGLIDIMHSGKFVIVDTSGGIRGYYDSDAEGLDEVYHRSRAVLRESR
jgi:protein SCO1/2